MKKELLILNNLLKKKKGKGERGVEKKLKISLIN